MNFKPYFSTSLPISPTTPPPTHPAHTRKRCLLSQARAVEARPGTSDQLAARPLTQSVQPGFSQTATRRCLRRAMLDEAPRKCSHSRYGDAVKSSTQGKLKSRRRNLAAASMRRGPSLLSGLWCTVRAVLRARGSPMTMPRRDCTAGSPQRQASARQRHRQVAVVPPPPPLSSSCVPPSVPPLSVPLAVPPLSSDSVLSLSVPPPPGSSTVSPPV